MDTRIVVPPPSTSFGFFNLLTVAFVYAKLEENLYVKWVYIFSPTLVKQIFIKKSINKVCLTYKLISCLI